MSPVDLSVGRTVKPTRSEPKKIIRRETSDLAVGQKPPMPEATDVPWFQESNDHAPFNPKMDEVIAERKRQEAERFRDLSLTMEGDVPTLRITTGTTTVVKPLTSTDLQYLRDRVETALESTNGLDGGESE